jgi:hypothetical protein
MGARMDSEPKRWRIFADVMYDIGGGLEVVSPLCPQHFLPVAGVANLAKVFYIHAAFLLLLLVSIIFPVHVFLLQRMQQLIS